MQEHTDIAPSTGRGRRPVPSVSWLLAIALAAEVAVLGLTIGEEIVSGAPGVRVFWFLLSLFLLYRVHRGGSLSWALLVSLGLVGGGMGLIALADPTGLGILLLVVVQLGALLARSVREHVGVAGAGRSMASS